VSEIHPGALRGIRVLDLSRVLAGPWCTQLMADFGAEVIKVERPGIGDDSRAWGPPFVELAPGEKVAAYFCCANRGKQSIALDIAEAQGRAAILQLALESDVLIENFKTGTLARYGLDYETLAKLNPRLIYCSITGYGKTGPYADRPGYDAVIQGIAGMMSVTGERDDQPGGGPQKVGVPITDIITGLYAAVGILTALRERDSSGLGQQIDLSLMDVLVTSMATLASSYLATGSAPVRQGNAHASVVPSDAFACRDGHILITAGNDAQFKKLCQALNADDMAADPRFATNEQRTLNRDVLIPLLRHLLSLQDRAPLIDAISAAGVPCGPINNLQQVFEDPQVRHADLIVSFQEAGVPAIRALANPLRLSRTPVRYGVRPPALGEHTDAVLARLAAAENT
jgi:crotonobetainyl-CoA:carnitine CoA-transferase CaiB-like acyl-CoA transferase